MTIIASSSSDTRTGRLHTLSWTEVGLSWTEVGPGLWVAKSGADFAGLIEKLWGAGYRATDSTGAVIGEFATLLSAKSHVA